MQKLSRGDSGAAVLTLASPGRDEVAAAPARAAARPLRSRFALESLWERKLDEVITLAAACQGVSAADDDPPAGEAAMPSLRLYRRAARAYEDLAAIAEAVDRARAAEPRPPGDIQAVTSRARR